MSLDRMVNRCWHIKTSGHGRTLPPGKNLVLRNPGGNVVDLYMVESCRRPQGADQVATGHFLPAANKVCCRGDLGYFEVVIREAEEGKRPVLFGLFQPSEPAADDATGAWSSEDQGDIPPSEG